MEALPERPERAWQPLTAGGVATFAHASLGRLLLIQFGVAMVAAGCVIWSVHAAWFPTIEEAIEQLPHQGLVRSGVLDWSGPSAQKLADSRFLSIAVDLRGEGTARSAAHLRVEFGSEEVRISSLLGYLHFGYPRYFTIAFNRAELKPWWGAWSPALLALLGAMVISGLLVTWVFLASLYCGVVWLAGFFGNRDLPLGASWRLAGAAMLPGALFMSLAIVVYGLGLLELPRLGMALALHFVIGWVYVAIAPFRARRLAGAEPLRKNPFSGAQERSGPPQGP